MPSMTPFPHGTPVYRTDEIRRIEMLAATETPEPLMERAGRAAADLAREILGDSGKPVAVLAGPGNNGGDALVLARHLRSSWFDVQVAFFGDESKLPQDAADALTAWRETGGVLLRELPPLHDCSLVVDGLFGIGLGRDLAGAYAERVARVNASGVPVLALDIPSGLDSDTGRVLGCAVRARHSVTFIGLKAGLLTRDGPDYAGTVHLADLGVAAAALAPPIGHVIADGVLPRALKPRAGNSHKGTYGSVGVIGGAAGMVGAALLAGRAALKTGAGRVYVGLVDERAPSFDADQLELMLRPAASILDLDHLSVAVVGPGLGTAADARTLLAAALESQLPLVLDADALNLIAADKALRAAFTARAAAALLTPHPTEAARLLDATTEAVQRDRVSAAVQLAKTYRSGVVLKGAGSVCAWPDGTWAINTSGNAGLASAGTGDVLSGILGALIAQGAAPESALEAGVYLHGAAADALLAAGCGPAGMLAGEVIDAARGVLNQAVNRRPGASFLGYR